MTNTFSRFLSCTRAQVRYLRQPVPPLQQKSRASAFTNATADGGGARTVLSGGGLTICSKKMLFNLFSNNAIFTFFFICLRRARVECAQEEHQRNGEQGQRWQHPAHRSRAFWRKPCQRQRPSLPFADESPDGITDVHTRVRAVPIHFCPFLLSPHANCPMRGHAAHMRVCVCEDASMPCTQTHSTPHCHVLSTAAQVRGTGCGGQHKAPSDWRTPAKASRASVPPLVRSHLHSVYRLLTATV